VAHRDTDADIEADIEADIGLPARVWATLNHCMAESLETRAFRARVGIAGGQHVV
jgi:hypothetical protein